MAKAGAQEDGVAKSEAVQGVGIAQAGEEIGRVTKPDQGAKMDQGCGETGDKAGAQEDGVAKSEAAQGVGIAQAGEEIGRVTKPDQGAQMDQGCGETGDAAMPEVSHQTGAGEVEASKQPDQINEQHKDRPEDSQEGKVTTNGKTAEWDEINGEPTAMAVDVPQGFLTASEGVVQEVTNPPTDAFDQLDAFMAEAPPELMAEKDSPNAEVTHSMQPGSPPRKIRKIAIDDSDNEEEARRSLQSSRDGPTIEEELMAKLEDNSNTDMFLGDAATTQEAPQISESPTADPYGRAYFKSLDECHLKAFVRQVRAHKLFQEYEKQLQTELGEDYTFFTDDEGRAFLKLV